MPTVIKKEARKSPATKGVFLFAISVMTAVAVSWFLGSSARAFFLSSLDDVDPIIAGGELDELPALMRGNVPIMQPDVWKLL